jgi:hypothetical protein
MKLTDIDLSNREEIEALRALLDVILLGNGTQSPAEVFAPAATIPAGLPPSNGVASAAPSAVVTMAGAMNGLPQLQAASVELDAEGLPWDERIHAGTKTKTQKGVWTARKGVNDDALVNSVKAQLRAQVGGTSAPVAPSIPAPQLPGAVALPAVAPVAPVLPPLTAGPSAPAVALPAPETFEQLMPRVAAAVGNGLIPPNALQTAFAGLGLQSTEHLQQNPAYVPHVWAARKAAHAELL